MGTPAGTEQPDEPANLGDAPEPGKARTWLRSALVANVLRVATVAVFLVCGLLLFDLLVDRGPEKRPFELPEFQPGELSVGAAISLETADPLTLRGFVFLGPGARELRLCMSRTRDHPPRCLGPFVSLEGVDPGSFELHSGDTDDGQVLYSPDDVLLNGSLIGTIMQVSVVLGTEG